MSGWLVARGRGNIILYSLCVQRTNTTAHVNAGIAGPVAGSSAGAPAPGATTASERERMLCAYIAELERAAEVRTGKIPPAPPAAVTAGVTDRHADALHPDAMRRHARQVWPAA